MNIELQELVRDFADALVAVDATRPVHKSFQPGVGPFGEADAVRAALNWLKSAKAEAYSRAVVKRLPDLLIPGEWAVELKVVRPFSDNGKPAERWSENVLHPYPGNTSSLGDCMKLLESPRGSPQNRPMRVTSKPANGLEAGQGLLYRAEAASGK